MHGWNDCTIETKTLPPILSKYKHDEIYNVDESFVLFFRM